VEIELPEQMMADNNDQGTGMLGFVLTAVVLLAAGVFILTGGQLGGKKQVMGDADLPPVTTGAPTK
jgi:hypothetical protein